MPFFIKDNGVQQKVKELYYKDSNVWNKSKLLYKDSGVWSNNVIIGWESVYELGFTGFNGISEIHASNPSSTNNERGIAINDKINVTNYNQLLFVYNAYSSGVGIKNVYFLITGDKNTGSGGFESRVASSSYGENLQITLSTSSFSGEYWVKSFVTNAQNTVAGAVVLRVLQVYGVPVSGPNELIWGI